MAATSRSASYLICRSASQRCGLPLECVVETMRPLPVEKSGDMPRAMLGVAVIRSMAVPVVDLAEPSESSTSAPTARYVLLRVGETRRVALAVSEVIGVRSIDGDASAEIAPLLGVLAPEVVAAIATLDADLVRVLQSARLMSESVGNDIDIEATAS